jgi:2,3-cyclic nucleotide 3-phosphodiesterase
MRKLLLLHGVSASGKSYWVKAKNMEPHTISYRDIQLMLGGVNLSKDSKELNVRVVDEVNAFILKALELRMKDGEFVIIDALNLNEEHTKEYKALADKYNYEVYWMDFPVDEETLKYNNASRKKYLRQPDYLLTFQQAQLLDLPYKKIDKLEEVVTVPVYENLDKYKGVIIVGDIHNCGYTLNEIVSKYGEDFKYILLGDYFDRGDKPYETFLILDYLTRRSNVTALLGNHEARLLQYINDEQVEGVSTIVSVTEMEHKGVTKEKLRSFYNRLLDCYTFEYRGKKYVCTHAGLPYMPREPVTVSTGQLTHSIDMYRDDIDKVYQENFKEGNPFQFHGHIPTESNKRSKSLDGRVEDGGYLAYAVIDEYGMKFKKVNNYKLEE